ncbi:hypothetical protein PIB30_012739 [Stylosanthes scabra]|uniref:Uncharacterized protein n=1 Tax=Stylosanthes scabra TaxID=79078 RepID=A0ABU6R6F3_9FABA|nr:hypothetical protein [Stylosanthes scabra]
MVGHEEENVHLQEAAATTDADTATEPPRPHSSVSSAAATLITVHPLHPLPHRRPAAALESRSSHRNTPPDAFNTPDATSTRSIFYGSAIFEPSSRRSTGFSRNSIRLNQDSSPLPASRFIHVAPSPG